MLQLGLEVLPFLVSKGEMSDMGYSAHQSRRCGSNVLYWRGWALSDYFPTTAASEVLRWEFAMNCVWLSGEYGFDEVNIVTPVRYVFPTFYNVITDHFLTSIPPIPLPDHNLIGNTPPREIILAPLKTQPTTSFSSKPFTTPAIN